MIEKTDAIVLLRNNFERTEMLIEAMEKIETYDRLYQMGLGDQKYHLAYRKAVKHVQDVQLEVIEQSCAEHAIISLATAFESYYRDLVQELLFEYPDHFLIRRTSYSGTVKDLIKGSATATYEEIGQALRLNRRFDYYKFFEAYSITFLSAAEKEFIEYIILLRNCYVHNAGRVDGKTREKLKHVDTHFDEDAIRTQAKKLRTKLNKILFKSHDQIKDMLTGG